MKRVLLLKPGVTSSRATLGDYEAWFGAAVEGLATLVPVELHAGERVPSFDGVDAVVMSGSPLSVTSPTGWMLEAADRMLEASAAGTPVLGVCFGHQLLAARLGGQVQVNPRGLELGTVQITLTETGRQDPLFEGFPPSAAVQATHFDEVAQTPPGSQVLATNDACPIQAFGVGATLRGVQFHPEMNRIEVAYCISHEPSLSAITRQQRLEAAHDTPWGVRLLRNFVSQF